MKAYELIEGNNYLKFELHYEKGGINYFSGKSDERGYYLSVRPVKVENEDGVRIESFFIMSGVRKLIKPVKRQSQKAYEESVSMSTESMDELRKYVLSRL